MRAILQQETANHNVSQSVLRFESVIVIVFAVSQGCLSTVCLGLHFISEQPFFAVALSVCPSRDGLKKTSRYYPETLQNRYGNRELNSGPAAC